MIINGQKKAYLISEEKYHCAMDVTMRFIGGKWKTVVLWYLISRKLRFAELKKMIPDITEKMLSLQLQALEKDGIVKREVFGEKPPIRVEYSLTDFGETLIPVLKAVAKWGREMGEANGEIVDV